MKILATIILFCFILSASSEALSMNDARLLLEYGPDQADCETEMANLDECALMLVLGRRLKAHVIVYGGRDTTAQDELRIRRSRINRYLVKDRGIDANRITVVDGGFRERLSIELWIVTLGAEPPETKPTVKEEEVKYINERYTNDCSNHY
jgi:hypothetical protein